MADKRADLVNRNIWVKAPSLAPLFKTKVHVAQEQRRGVESAEVAGANPVMDTTLSGGISSIEEHLPYTQKTVEHNHHPLPTITAVFVQ